MFEDQNAARTEQPAFQDQLHDLLAALQVVGGVGEDHVELLGAAFQVEENVGLDRVEVFDPQQCGRPAAPRPEPAGAGRFRRRGLPAAVLFPAQAKKQTFSCNNHF